MWERGVLQGPGKAALGTWQVRRGQAPPGRREENQGGDSPGQRLYTSPLSGPQLQPLRPLSLPLTCQYPPSHPPRIIPHRPAFSAPSPSGVTSSSTRFAGQRGVTHAFPQEPSQHFLGPRHSESRRQAFGGFIMAHLIRVLGQVPGLMPTLCGRRLVTGPSPVAGCLPLNRPCPLTRT